MTGDVAARSISIRLVDFHRSLFLAVLAPISSHGRQLSVSRQVSSDLQPGLTVRTIHRRYDIEVHLISSGSVRRTRSMLRLELRGSTDANAQSLHLTRRTAHELSCFLVPSELERAKGAPITVDGDAGMVGARQKRQLRPAVRTARWPVRGFDT